MVRIARTGFKVADIMGYFPVLKYLQKPLDRHCDWLISKASLIALEAHYDRTRGSWHSAIGTMIFLGILIGFVAGELVFRNNASKAESIVKEVEDKAKSFKK